MYDTPALPLPRGLQKNKKIKTSIGNPTKFPISNRSRGSLGMWCKISLFISHGVDCTTPTVFLTSPRPLGEVQNSSFFTKRGWSCYLLLKGFPELPKLSRPLANRKQDIQVCQAGNLAFSYLTEEARGKLRKRSLAAPARQKLWFPGCTRQLTTCWNTSPRRPDPVFLPPRSRHSCVAHRFRQENIYTNKMKSLLFFLEP